MFLDARAMYNVGYMLEHGEGGAEVDVPRALGLYRNCTEDPFGGWRVIGWLGRRGVCSLLRTVLWECVRSGFCLSTWDGLVFDSSAAVGSVYPEHVPVCPRTSLFRAEEGLLPCAMAYARLRAIAWWHGIDVGRGSGGAGDDSDRPSLWDALWNALESGGPAYVV